MLIIDNPLPFSISCIFLLVLEFSTLFFFPGFLCDSAVPESAAQSPAYSTEDQQHLRMERLAVPCQELQLVRDGGQRAFGEPGLCQLPPVPQVTLSLFPQTLPLECTCAGKAASQAGFQHWSALWLKVCRHPNSHTNALFFPHTVNTKLEDHRMSLAQNKIYKEALSRIL